MPYIGTQANGGGNLTLKQFSGDNSTTAFTLDVTPASVYAVLVFISGVMQVPGVDYTLSGTTLTFTTAPPTGTSNIATLVSGILPVATPADGSVTGTKLASNAVSGLTALAAASLDRSADYLLIEDASAAANKKITADSLNTRVLLSAQTASSSAQLDFTNLTGYSHYEFLFTDVVPATDAVAMYGYFSTDNGSTFLGGTAYATAVWDIAHDASTSGAAGGSGAAQFTVVPASISNGSSSGVRVGRVLTNDLSSTLSKTVLVDVARINSSGLLVRSSGTGHCTTSSVVNAMRFKFSSGNITSGTIRCYGLR